jgi:hypothetical protein
MGVATAVVVGAVVAGAVAGSMKDKSTQASGMNLGGASGLEQQGTKVESDSLSQLTDMVNSGPGEADTTNAYNDSKSLANMLDQYSKQGGANPNAQDISTSNSLAQQLFQGQRTALSQNMNDQNMYANREAALTGRSVNDPILRNKLAVEQMRQSSMLDANQGAFAAQYAQNQPMQRLGFAQQQNGILNGLATQAMSNRQALMGIGEGVVNNERNFRIATADKWGTQESGGGLKGALNGGIAGLGAGMGLAGSMGAGSGGGAPMSGGGYGGGGGGGMSYFNGSNPYASGGGGMAQQFQSQGANFQQPRSNYGVGQGGGYMFSGNQSRGMQNNNPNNVGGY